MLKVVLNQGEIMQKILNKISLLVAFCLLVVVVAGCKDNGTKPKEENNVDLIEKTTPLFDSLKGEWSWFKSIVAGGGIIIDNEFKSIIKILSQNKDTSINYEVIVEDTLFYKGSFQILYDEHIVGYSGNAVMTLPFLIWWNEDQLSTQSLKWFIYFGDPKQGIVSRDTLCFDNCPVLCLAEGDKYYYQRIK